MGNTHLKKNMNKVLVVGLVLFLSYRALAYRSASAPVSQESTFFYVGTYINRGNSQEASIYHYELTTNGALNLISASNGGESPSHMAISKDNNYIHAVNELEKGSYQLSK